MIPDKQDRRAVADARFKAREQQRIDAPLAVQEYYAAQEAERQKTLRLRALRLSRPPQSKPLAKRAAATAKRRSEVATRSA